MKTKQQYVPPSQWDPIEPNNQLFKKLARSRAKTNDRLLNKSQSRNMKKKGRVSLGIEHDFLLNYKITKNRRSASPNNQQKYHKTKPLFQTNPRKNQELFKELSTTKLLQKQSEQIRMTKFKAFEDKLNCLISDEYISSDPLGRIKQDPLTRSQPWA